MLYALPFESLWNKDKFWVNCTYLFCSCAMDYKFSIVCAAATCVKFPSSAKEIYLLYCSKYGFV